MKHSSKLLSLLAALLAASMLCACGAKSESSDAYDSAEKPAVGTQNSAEYGYDGGYREEADAANTQYGLKMTYSADIYLETLQYDESAAALFDAVKKAGGYISYQSSGGGYTSVSGNYISRDLNLEVKIPAENFQAFLDGAQAYGNVTSLSSRAEDITAQYVDTEARLSSLRAQQERLNAMMGKADTVTDLIEIEAQLSEVIYQLESYTAQMKVYENLVAYSSVDITLSEVQNVTYKANTFLDRILSALRNSGRNLVSFLEEAVLFLIYALPFAALIALAIWLIRRVMRAVRAKRIANGTAKSPRCFRSRRDAGKAQADAPAEPTQEDAGGPKAE